MFLHCSLLSEDRASVCCAGALQTSNNGQLQQDKRWDASHYGNLEQFIFDYLTGGTSAGETVRLKLQTPLFVAEALAQAAHRQLTDELETATQVNHILIGPLLMLPCYSAHACLLLPMLRVCCHFVPRVKPRVQSCMQVRSCIQYATYRVVWCCCLGTQGSGSCPVRAGDLPS